jgi:thioesterase domain-containing protein
MRSNREAVWRANVSRSLISALERYRPNGPIDSPLHYFKAVESAGKFDADWSRLTKGSFTVHRVPGNHFSMLRKPHVNDLAHILFESVKRSLRREEWSRQADA